MQFPIICTQLHNTLARNSARVTMTTKWTEKWVQSLLDVCLTNKAVCTSTGVVSVLHVCRYAVYILNSETVSPWPRYYTERMLILTILTAAIVERYLHIGQVSIRHAVLRPLNFNLQQWINVCVHGTYVQDCICIYILPYKATSDETELEHVTWFSVALLLVLKAMLAPFLNAT